MAVLLRSCAGGAPPGVSGGKVARTAFAALVAALISLAPSVSLAAHGAKVMRRLGFNPHPASVGILSSVGKADINAFCLNARRRAVTNSCLMRASDPCPLERGMNTT